MSNFNIDDGLRRRPIGPVLTSLKGVFSLDAARLDARGRAVR